MEITMIDAAQRIAQLSPAKLGLLAERLMGEPQRDRLLQPIPCHVGPTGPAPLSFAQERLWFLYRLEPESAVYNIPRAFRLTGDLNFSVLERCLTEIVRRHETLRTSFEEVEGKPVQSVGPPFTVTIPLHDLRELPEAERESVARRLAAEEALKPFDLKRGAMFRAQLLRLQDDEYLALFTIHHIVSDAWSAGVLLGELVTLYRAFSADLPSPLAELPIQYADFARWQRSSQGKRLDEMTAYWRSQLSGANDSLKLPTDRPRPEVQDFSGARHTITLAKKLTLAIKTLSRQERTTLFTTLLTAFNLLLYFHSGQEDIVVGSPIANRTRFESKGLIGFFVNTLALRTDLTGDPTFRELLARTSEMTRQAFANQDLPFDRLVKVMKPERSLSHMPLFQVVFHMNNAPKAEFALPGLKLSALQTGALTVPFCIVVHATEVASDELLLALEYQTALFDASTTSRLLAELVSVLEVVTARPNATLSELRELYVETERRQKINRETRLEEVTRQKLATVRRRVVVENQS
jgi:hypothetical protein